VFTWDPAGAPLGLDGRQVRRRGCRTGDGVGPAGLAGVQFPAGDQQASAHDVREKAVFGGDLEVVGGAAVEHGDQDSALPRSWSPADRPHLQKLRDAPRGFTLARRGRRAAPRRRAVDDTLDFDTASAFSAARSADRPKFDPGIFIP
jgi:hypothetical protein